MQLAREYQIVAEGTESFVLDDLQLLRLNLDGFHLLQSMA
jgi:hypothetical protein